MFQLDVLNQKRILEDGYDEYYSYDDCILDNISKNYHDHDIKDFLISKENKKISKVINESLFKDLSNQFEYMIKHGKCNDPNMKIQTTYTLTSLDSMKRSSFIGYDDLFEYGLEFPISTLVKEVN